MKRIEEARASILASVGRTGTERVPFDDAVGRILAEAVVAPHDVPSFANSAMDGFAVRADDVAEPGAVLDIIGEIAAGVGEDIPVSAGQAVRIMTGAPMPSGADTIVRVEDTSEDDGKVTISPVVPAGTSVRPPGGDVRQGAEVIAAGTRLSAAHIGVMATIGAVEPVVARRPKVGVMSTGDELVDPTAGGLDRGFIRDSNRPMLLSLVAEAGAEPVDLGRVPDDAGALRATLAEGAANCDLMVSSGGVSMGEYDVVKLVLREEADVEFYPVAMRPGQPQGFGNVGGKPFFGLPGNPVSVFVSFEQFVRPALLAMMGATALLRPRVEGIAGDDLTSSEAKDEFLRVVLEPGANPPVVTRTGGQGSHVLSGVAGADAFAVIPRGVETVPKGGRVTLELFRNVETRRP